MNPITPAPSPVFPRSPNVPIIARQCSHWRGNLFPPSPRPQARQPLFYVLPPAGYFCHQRQKYPKTPLETTFQDFLGALRPVPNLTHVPRTIGFSVCRCRSRDCATTAFRCRFAAAARCHGRSFPLYRRNLERISPFRHAAPVRACHSEPARRLARQSVPPSPRPQARQPLFTFASGGHLSFNSERKVRKNATKTYGFGFPQRAMRCRKLALCSSRNRIFRVPLSVKRTVPPQLSAVASLPLPVVTVAVSTSTAVTGREL